MINKNYNKIIKLIIRLKLLINSINNKIIYY